jgi:heme A synthase
LKRFVTAQSNMNEASHPSVPRWLRAWAVLTVVTALPLLVLGAEVTTKKVGMADTTAVREPWYLFTLSAQTRAEQGAGLTIEHSHRTAGWLVGICSIVLAVGMWFGARGSKLRASGLVVLVLVSLQGILGIGRVKWNALAGPEMAMVHGVFAQVVFATLVAVAVLSFRTWNSDDAEPRPGPRRLATLLAIATFAQIAFGSLVRHQLSPAAQRVHVLFAFAVVALSVWLLRASREVPVDQALRRFALVLVGLVTVQVAFGVEAWIRRFGAGVPVEVLQYNATSDFVRTAHFFLGALLFSTTIAINVLLYRPARATSVAPVEALAAGRMTAQIGGAM